MFREASEKSPTVIFIDEIDSLCPKRKDAGTGTEKRVISTLLTSMDGINSSSKIVVIAATNRVDSIDEALRRPGRFDQEIEVGIPGVPQRLAILKAIMRKTPHTLTEGQFQQIADVTHGYVGADMASLYQETSIRIVQNISE